MNGVQALCPAGTRSRCSRYGKLLTVNLVRVAYVLTVINIIYFSTWLHKHKVRLTKFWNSDRNHNALREMFSSLQQSLGRHQAPIFDLTCWISSGLTACVRDCPCFTVFRMKIEQTHASLSNSMQFWGNDDLCKLGKEYLTAVKCNLTHFILNKILKLFTYLHAFLSLVVAKLCDLKYSPAFLAHPVYERTFS